MPPNPAPWRPRVHVRRVVDGDTFRGDLDLGWHTWQLDPGRGGAGSFRLWGIDAPELGTPAGADAAGYLAGLLAPGGQLGTFPILSYEVRWQDNFGRTLCDLELPNGELVTEAMLGAGHAVVWPHA